MLRMWKQNLTLLALAFVTSCGCPRGAINYPPEAIAFSRTIGANHDIYLIHPDGTGLTQVTSTPNLLEIRPNWRPGGQQLAIARKPVNGGHWDIVLLASNGQFLLQLTNTPNDDETDPAWSPDGMKIAFVRSHHDPSGNDTLHLIVADSTDANEVDLTGGSDLEPISKPSLLKGDDPACEVDKGEIVACLALPSDEQSAETIVPGVGSLDDPATRPAAYTAYHRWFAATPNVRLDPSDSNLDFRVEIIVTLVQAQVRWPSHAATGFDNDGVEHLAERRQLFLQTGGNYFCRSGAG